MSLGNLKEQKLDKLRKNSNIILLGVGTLYIRISVKTPLKLPDNLADPNVKHLCVGVEATIDVIAPNHTADFIGIGIATSEACTCSSKHGRYCALIKGHMWQLSRGARDEPKSVEHVMNQGVRSTDAGERSDEAQNMISPKKRPQLSRRASRFTCCMS